MLPAVSSPVTLEHSQDSEGPTRGGVWPIALR